jgi:hypothetical protein
MLETKTQMNKIFALLLLVIFVAGTAMAQQKLSRRLPKHKLKQIRHWSFGGSLNASHYFGDLSPSSEYFGEFTSKGYKAPTDFNFTKAVFGAFGQYRYHPRYSFRVEFVTTTFTGDDNSSAAFGEIGSKPWYRWMRNLHFRNRIYELSGMWIADFVENRGPFFKRPKGFIPYSLIGLSVFYHNPQGKAPDGTWVDLKPLRLNESDYSLLQIAVPMGIGIKRRISNKLDVAFEWVVRFTFTDGLDDVTGYYMSDEQLGNNTLRIAMHDRSKEPTSLFNNAVRDPSRVAQIPQFAKGDQREKRGDDDFDQYVIYGFKLIYHFGGDVKCPRLGR